MKNGLAMVYVRLVSDMIQNKEKYNCFYVIWPNRMCMMGSRLSYIKNEKECTLTSIENSPAECNSY